MRNIIVVECVSTGINFIQDIVNSNYNPIALETKVEENEDYDFYDNFRKGSYERISHDFELIRERDTYAETLEMVRQYDPVLVVPGSERGVILATKLANDLKLKCNSIENLDAMTLKDKMQERLAERGVRHIRGRTVRSVEEAVRFYDEENLDEVVIKPVYGSWSVGVRICQDRQDMIDSLNEVFNGYNIYGDTVDEFVVQERIDGEEYIVNTVSCNGSHRVTLIWKYNKVRSSEGGQVYESCISINELGLGEAELVEYAYDVADALGIEYGAVHGEYMIDDNGPVLIEVNCRPCGAGMSIEFLDKISGQHETDSILDAYLNPDKFKYQKARGYHLFAYGALKLIVVPADIIALSAPMNYIGVNLKSHNETRIGIIEQSKPFVKTQDLETSGGTIFLAHEDENVVRKDLEFLKSIEKYAFHLVLSDNSDKKTEIDEGKSYEDAKYIIDSVNSLGSTLLVTDQAFEDMDLMQVSPDELESVEGEFDCVVVNLNTSLVGKKDDMITYLLLNIIKRVKKGGLIFIPQTTYQYIPHGRIGVEALIKVADLKIELPQDNLNKVVIASKR